VLIGGCLSATKEITSKVSTFNSLTQTWTSYYPDMQSVQSRPGVALYLEYVIVVGGNTDENLCLDTIEILSYIDPMLP